MFEVPANSVLYDDTQNRQIFPKIISHETNEQGQWFPTDMAQERAIPTMSDCNLALWELPDQKHSQTSIIKMKLLHRV